MIVPRFLSLVVIASALVTIALPGPMATAQTSTITPRISGPVDESSLTTLQGNVPPKARPEFDKGEAAASTELTFVRLVLSRSPQQEADLERFMAQQLDQSSPNYHHWLTPEEFGKLYGPADSDIAAIVAWLQSHGLKVESVSTGRTNIAFSGTVSQVEEALHTSIHSFDAHGEQFLSNVSDPRIPSAFAPVVSGVAQLNTLRPKPYNVPGRFGQLDPATHRLVPADTLSSGPTPELTTGSTGSYSLYLVPGDAATIYNTPNSLNANFAAGTSYNGSGVTIGIGGDALIQAATVVNYRTKFLNDATAPTITNVAPAAVAGQNTDEGYLDVEISGGLAPGASLFFYTSNDLPTAINQAINDNKIDIFSLSFGACELSLGNSGNTLLNGYWKQAATQGIAVVVSTGDSGSAGCDNNNTETSAVDGLQVSGYASTPYNIAVGGTDYYSLITGFTTYVNTTNGTLYATAKSYIPESTWNMSTTIDTGSWNANIPAQDPLKNNATNIVAGGGGVSACSTNTTTTNTLGTCTSGYAKPSWQRGAGVPSDGLRDIPDVSLFAGAGGDGAAWLVCTDDTPSAGVTTNCTGTSFTFFGFGGTSTSAPAFAGMLALVQQKAGSRLGLAAKSLYDLFNGAHANSVFHDVTVGNISVVCTVGRPDCVKNAAGNNFLSGYDTTAGYDLATGMGSVDVTQLIANWATATGGGTATITVTPSATAVTSLQSLTVAVTVAGSGGLGTPTGTVTLAGGGFSSPPTALDATGAASFTIPAGTLQPGSIALVATYSGNADYATISGQAIVTVTAVNYTITATTPAAVTPGNSATSTLTISSGNGYAGSIVLSCAVATTPTGAVDIPSCTVTSGTPVTLTSTVTTGTATVGFSTTAPIATLSRPRTGGWEGAGTAVLALLVFFGIPSRRRGWRAILGLIVMSAALMGLSACGGGGGSGGGGGGNSNPGTTAGTYTYTVTGTGTPAVSPVPTGVITLTVN